MQITYHGHACFRLKGKKGIVVMDPFDEYLGFKMSNLSADIVTTSHDHKDHNQIAKVKGTTRREIPFVINYPGDYEVGGISVFGLKSYHDTSQGAERGNNTIFTVLIDNVRVCHLGDLGHTLNDDLLAKIGDVDVLLIPVGGVYTIDPEQAIKVVKAIEPSFVIPMHYKTEQHESSVFGELATDKDFFKLLDKEPAPVEKLNVERDRLPEETEIISLIKT